MQEEILLFVETVAEFDPASFLSSIDWLRIGIIVGIVVLISCTLVGMIFMIRRFYYLNVGEQKEEGKKWDNNQRATLQEILKIDFDRLSSRGIKEKLADIKCNKFLRFYGNYQPEIDEFYQKAEKIITEREIEEERIRQYEREAEEREQRLEEQQERKRQELVQGLFEFKIARKNSDVLPLDTVYPTDVITAATRKAKNYFEEQEENKQIAQKAVKYYRHNDLDTIPHLETEKEKRIFLETNEKIKNGETEAREVKSEELSKHFYRAKDLDEELKRKAVAQGFEHTRGIELDGRICGGGFYIRRHKNESAYHFCMKHLFQELHQKMMVEYEIAGRRADVALITESLRLAIEIESGTNNADQLTAKAQWAEEHFDHCVLVCSRENLAKYKELLKDYSKMACLTTKEAKEKVIQLLNSYKI